MNKSELVDAVASGAGVSRGDAEGVLTTFFETVRSSAKRGETVSWPGFGKFKTAPRAARTARNPQTGQSVKVKASTAMKFAPSSVLKEFLNTKGTGKKAPAKATAGTKAASGGKASAAKAPAAKATSRNAAATSTGTKAATAKAPAAKRAATKGTGTNSTPTKKAPAKKAPATKASTAKSPAKKAPAKRSR